jgi:hypothetical protein
VADWLCLAQRAARITCCLEHLDFGFVSGFELRISDLPGSAEPGRLALFFHSAPIFSPENQEIGFVWHCVHTADAHPGPWGRLSETINHQ